GVGPFEAKATHVRYVEERRRLPRRRVFVDDRRVLHRHRPAGEIDHPAAMRDAPVVESRPRAMVAHVAPLRTPLGIVANGILANRTSNASGALSFRAPPLPRPNEPLTLFSADARQHGVERLLEHASALFDALHLFRPEIKLEAILGA